MANKTYRSVLLVDDNDIDNLINRKMLEAAGITSKIFVNTSAKSALEFLKNLFLIDDKKGSYLPELLFLDIDMPLMDGYQFLDEFGKLDQGIQDRVTIVMLTSSINPQDERRAKSYSYVKTFLHKPLSKEILLGMNP